MVQLDDENYAKLKKDADDNRSIKTIAKWVVGLVIFLVLYFTAGTRFINIQIARSQAAMERESEILQAQVAVRVREIESQGMTMDEYLKWYSICHDVN